MVFEMTAEATDGPAMSCGAVDSGDDGPVEFALDRPPVDDRGWGPTLLLCVAILFSAVIVVVAKPLTAGAASSRGHAHTHAHTTTVASVKTHARTPAPVTPGLATSPNWSGYVAYAKSINDGSFNQVSAQWVEPSVTCPRKDAWTLFWVGFDGWPASDRSVEQGGTSAQCVGGVPRYSAFYEMWPTYAVTTLFPISAGDLISAGVVYSTTTQQFEITVTDLTPGHEQSMTESESCPPTLACARTSAEWIAESPSHFGTDNWFPLADYGTVDFTEATTTDAYGYSGPISDDEWANSGIERVAGATKPLAEVSSLQSTDSASSFSDTWHRRAR